MKSILSILLAISSVAWDEHAQTTQDGVVIDVTVEPTTFTVGDSISLQIHAVAQKNIQLSILHDDAFGSFVVTDEATLLDVPVEGGRQWVWAYQLDTFDASTTSIPDINLHWTDAKGQTGTIAIDPLPVQVATVAGDALQEMELRDLKGTLPLFSKTGFWPFLILGGILLAGLVWVTRVIFMKPKRSLSPYAKAMFALQTLGRSDQDVQTFYTSMTNIVRTYIEDRFQISAHGRTTREFLIAEKENPRLEHSDRQALADFLVAADLVKFARHEPHSNSWSDAIQSAEQFISNTMGSQNPQLQEVVT